MEFPDRNPILVLRTTVSRLARVADAGQSGFYLPTRSKGINERETSAYAKSGRSLLRFPTAGKSQTTSFAGLYGKQAFYDTRADMSALSVSLGPFYVPTPERQSLNLIGTIYVQ